MSLLRKYFERSYERMSPAVRAAERTWDLFLEIVGRIVGPQQAQHYGALLLTSVHGITTLESSGHLVWDKW